MDQLNEIFENNNIEIAVPTDPGNQRFNKVNKEAMKKQLDTRQRTAQMQSIIRALPKEKRTEHILSLKAIADSLFKEKNYSEALAGYMDIVMSTTQDEMTPEEKEKFEKEILIKVFCNMATTCYQLKKFQAAIDLSAKAREIEPNVRSDFIAANSALKLEKYNLAREFTLSAISLTPENDTEKREELKDLLERISSDQKADDRRQKNLYGGFFPKLPDPPAKSPKPEPKKGLCQKIKDTFWRMVTSQKKNQ